MGIAQLVPSALVIVLCVISGSADAQGFLHASRMWRADRLLWSELGLSAGGFSVGIGSYWTSLRFMHSLGIVSPEMQTIIWFAVTIIGVALANGRFGGWPMSDRLVAGAVILGLGWLLMRSATVS
jgi:hypothetical protein